MRRSSLLWTALACLGLLILGGYALMAGTADIRRSPEAIGTYIYLFGALFALYLLACFIVLRWERELPLLPTLVLIALVATGARALLVPAPPMLSNDIYRYVWDGRVQAAGLSPYAYSPGAAELDWLHPPDYWLWEHINRKGAITIYPAGAELFFAAIYKLNPDSIAWTKAVLVTVDLLNCLALGLLLAQLGMAPVRVLAYAWAPLPIVEFGSSGHIEALAVLLTLLALLAAVAAVKRFEPGKRAFGAPQPPELADPAQRKERSGWALLVLAGVFLAGAALVKLIPLILLAAWWRRFGWPLAVVCVALFALVSAAFITLNGGHVSNFLVTYLSAEDFNAPVYYFLAKSPDRPFMLPDGAVRLALLAAIAVAGTAMLLRRERERYSFIGKSFLLVAAYLALATNQHVWYFTWLLLFVPLLLPPHGLSVLDRAPAGERVRLLRGDYGPALAALLYCGIAFAGYSLFALRIADVPAPIAAAELSLVLLIGVAWPIAGGVYSRVVARPAPASRLA